MVKVHDATHAHKASSPNVIVFDTMPDGHPCYTLVGQIAAEAARIERILDYCIAEVAGLESAVGACITSQLMGTNPRFDALRKLVAWKGIGDFEKLILSMKMKTGADMTPRNAAVHDPWLVDVSTGEPHQHRGMRKARIYGHIHNDERTLELTLAKLRKRREAVMSLTTDILGAAGLA